MTDLTLDIDGPVHVVDHGGEGPALLLVHGLGGSHLDWSDVAPSFTRHHHVWAVDLIGFGRTPVEGRHASIDDNRRLVDGVAERVGQGQPVLLMGNSMGGLISILEASCQPERVSGLILVDPALPSARGGRLSVMIAAAFLVLTVPGVGGRVMQGHTRRRGAERLVDDVLTLCTVDTSRINSRTRDAQIELTRWRQGLDEPDRAFLEASRSLVRWLLRRATLEPHIRRIQAPTLLIHGDTDRLVSLSAAGAVATLRPDWEFRVLTSTGHVPQLERPQAFVALVDHWLESQPGLRRRAQPAERAVSTSRR